MCQDLSVAYASHAVLYDGAPQTKTRCAWWICQLILWTLRYAGIRHAEKSTVTNRNSKSALGQHLKGQPAGFKYKMVLTTWQLIYPSLQCVRPDVVDHACLRYGKHVVSYHQSQRQFFYCPMSKTCLLYTSPSPRDS